jgi:HD-GYP domain-containing protein (c-di-GMP phosphodiesterase class II)
VLACDTFSAMTTDRSYRKARSTAEAIAELRRCANSQFDPAVVAVLIEIISEGEDMRPIPIRPHVEHTPKALPSAGSAVSGQS